jgi:hypothetical protein
MKHESIFIHTPSKTIEILIGEFGSEVDGDKLTSIDYSNLYGEAISVSALLNKVGILKSQAEDQYNEKKLEFDIYEAERRKEMRRQATDNGGKFQYEKDGEWMKMTEKSLDEAIILDKGWQVKKKNVFKAQKDLGFVDALYWGIQSKDRKLSVMMKGVSPEELSNEIVEGSINTLFIKKHKKLSNN